MGCVEASERFTLEAVRYAKVFIIFSALFACTQATTSSPLAAGEQASPQRPARSYTQLLRAAQEALAQGHAESAATMAADATHLDAGRYEAFLIWGQALAQNDHLQQSSQKYEQARALGCRDPDLFAQLASNYDVMQRYDDAVAIYLDYLQDHPRDAEIRDELALTYLLLKQNDAALTQLHRAHSLAPANLQIVQDLGYAFLQSQQFAEAERILADLVRSDPQRLEAQRLWSQALIGLSQDAQAIDILEQILNAHPHDKQSLALLRALRKRQNLTK